MSNMEDNDQELVFYMALFILVFFAINSAKFI